MTTYNVALKEGVDYDQFWNEIETSGLGGPYVPDRAVDIVYERPTSLRQCWYDLTDEEANTLRNDPRVFCVEIPPEFRTDIKIMPSASQTGLYYKSPNTGNNPDNNQGINWGLFRLNSTTNNTTSSSGNLIYDYPLDGSGVDIVIMDGGCQINHPDFEDSAGVSRINTIDWFAESGISGTMPVTFYTDNDGHGTHCTGISAGLRYGRAKNAQIYIMTVAGLAVAPTVGISPTYAFDCITGWHNNKPVDPATGYKRPTVVNMSWGYIAVIQNVASITYQGTTTASPTLSQQQSAGLIGAYRSAYGANIYGVRNSSVDTDVAEMISAGIVLVGAAGNYYQTLATYSSDPNDNYNNYWTDNLAVIRYYMQGGSPACANAVICVGNVDSVAQSGTTEQKAQSSESGPRVDVWAPGTNIVSTTSNTNIYGATATYPNSSFKIMSISGTSMAAPQVAGLCAQLLQVYPTATPTQIREKVISTSTANVLYTTGSSTDYTNTRSLHGGPNQFAYQTFNSANNFAISNGITLTNITLVNT